MKKLFTAILPLLLVVNSVCGSHIVGGDLGVERKNANNFRFYLNLYFDVANGNEAAYDPEIQISVFRKSDNQKITVFGLPNVGSPVPVHYSNPACVSADLQTNLLLYEKTVLLDAAIYSHPDGYYISWQRCCRNYNISNISDPGNTGMVFYAEFPPITSGNINFINSSPVFPPVLGDYLNLNEFYTYSNAATDPDGDVLKYSLVTPLAGTSTPTQPYPSNDPAPYRLVNWNPTFGINSIIPGAPALTIDAQTGLLSVAPLSQGLFVFSVLCEEFRNGNKIGEVRRDFQWQVIHNPINTAPQISLFSPDGSLYLPGDTLTVTNALDLCYNLQAKDTQGTRLSFTIKPLDFTQPVLSVSPESAVVNEANGLINSTLCWPDCGISRDGLYNFEIEVTDNGCPRPLKATIPVKLRVIPEPNLPPVVSTSLGSQVIYMAIGDSAQFDVTGTEPDNEAVFLSYEGTDFDPSSLGMLFENGSGAGTHTAPFFWKPDCGALALPQPLRVIFRAKDNSCFSQNADTSSVLFFLSDKNSEDSKFIPANIFTPNGDGVNDVFQFPNLPYNNCGSQFEKIQIFNRWGKKVFQSELRTASWDGKYSPDGVYFYLITFSNRQFKGTVTIVR